MNVLLQSSEKNPMSIPEPFNRFEDRSRIKCIKGPLGIMNGYPQISDLLEDYTGYVLYLSPVETPSGHAVVFRIRFSDPADCDVLQGQLEGMSLQVDKPCYVQIIRQDPVTLLFTDPGTIPLSNLPSFY
jgi:hypothetical protein